MAAIWSKSQEKDEDYWLDSSATKLMTGGVNLFDDSVAPDDIKRHMQTTNVQDEDAAVEYVSPERKIAAKNISAASAAATVTGASAKKTPSRVAYPKQQVQKCKKERWVPLSPRDTIRRIMFGEPFSLEGYKSKEEKLQLIDEAIKMHDGNAITAAVVFVSNTLKETIFESEMILRPVAMQHYINYLRQSHEVDKLVTILRMLGRVEEAAMLRLKQALSRKAGESRMRALQDCYSADFKSDARLSDDAATVQQEITLIERQLPIEQADLQEVERKSPLFVENPRQCSLLDQPVITTLYYCCFYHYNLAENCFASPVAIRKTHHLTDRQYMWTVVRARAKRKQWCDIEAFFTTKSWLGGTKMKAPIGFDRVVQQLQKDGAPRDVLNTYCNQIDDLNLRLKLGDKYQCYESVIMTLSQMKDRQQLYEYQQKLTPNSQQWFLAASVLKNTSIKWKN